jgi:hypothetical protein
MFMFSSSISSNIRSGRNVITSLRNNFISASSTPRGSLDPFAYFSVAMLFSKIIDIAA